MSGEGAPTIEPVDCTGQHVAIVASLWHPTIMDGLVAGALRACVDYRVTTPEVVRVPGAFELPQMAQHLAERYASYEAIVALGVVIRGGTPHFEYVCNAVTDGLMRVALDHSPVIGFGVLTTDTEEQALARAGLAGSVEDKGYEAASAAMSTAWTKSHLPPS